MATITKQAARTYRVVLTAAEAAALSDEVAIRTRKFVADGEPAVTDLDVLDRLVSGTLKTWAAKRAKRRADRRADLHRKLTPAARTAYEAKLSEADGLLGGDVNKI